MKLWVWVFELTRALYPGSTVLLLLWTKNNKRTTTSLRYITCFHISFSTLLFWFHAKNLLITTFVSGKKIYSQQLEITYKIAIKFSSSNQNHWWAKNCPIWNWRENLVSLLPFCMQTWFSASHDRIEAFYSLCCCYKWELWAEFQTISQADISNCGKMRLNVAILRLQSHKSPLPPAEAASRLKLIFVKFKSSVN